MKIMRLYRYIVPFLLLLLLSCKRDEESGILQKCPVIVGFYAGDAESRTTLDEDGLTTSWSRGDCVSLWAKDEAGDYVLSNTKFSIYDDLLPRAALFTATLPDAMAQGRYTYYAAYPVPQQVEGTVATFQLPDIQDGKVSDGCDILVAQPVEGDELHARIYNNDSEIDYTREGLHLALKHKVHLLKFYIDEAEKMDEPVRRIVFVTPQAVVGTMTLDVADADSHLKLLEGSNRVTLQLDSPLAYSTTASRAYASASILPQSFEEGDLEIQLYTESYQMRAATRSLAGRTLVAGHATPVRLIPQERVESRKLRFVLGENLLGEAITQVTLTAPEGVCWSVGGSNVLKIDATQLYQTGYFDVVFDSFDEASKACYEALSGQTITATYESAHAEGITTSVVLDALTGGCTTVTLNVPYLFEENFDAVTEFSNHDNAAVGGTTIDTYTTAIALDDMGLAGWSGTRCGSDGKSLRICVRTEDGLFAVVRYHGRVDTAPLSHIKQGQTVRVKVSFDYSMSTTRSQHVTLGAYGYHTTEGLISGTTGDSPSIAYEESGITGTECSYDSINEQKSYYIDECTSAHRLVWEVYSSGRRTGNSNGHFYIDNVRVQIEDK
jgi:hypothetical protein